MIVRFESTFPTFSIFGKPSYNLVGPQEYVKSIDLIIKPDCLKSY